MANGGGEMPIHVYLLTISLPLATVLIVFAMRYASAFFQARAKLASETTYRTLAEQALAVQTENQLSLSAIKAELSAVSARLASVEKILQQVE